MVSGSSRMGQGRACAPRVPLDLTKDPPLIGKHELLRWVSEVVGDIGDEVDYDTLRFGHVFLRIFQEIWPDLMTQYEHQVYIYPQTSSDVSANWRIIETTLKRLSIPVSFVNQAEVRAGSASACYQALVLLFFLHRLARDHECEFVLAHPVDSELTKFMSSEAPLACLVSGGSVELPSPLRERLLTPRSSVSLHSQRHTQADDSSECKAFSSSDSHKLTDADDLDSCKHLTWDDASGGRNLTKVEVTQEDLPKETSTALHTRARKDLEFQSLCTQQSPDQPGERQLSISPGASTGLPAGTKAHIVGGTFDSEGQFSATTLPLLSSSAVLPNLMDSGLRKDAEVQTRGLNAIPSIPSTIEWCDEKQKLKGEQLVEALRCQLELAQRQLQQGEAEMVAYKRQQRLQFDQMKAAAEAEMQRHREQSHSEILELKNKYMSDLQAIRNQTDLRMRQIEDDVAIDIEVLTSKHPSLSSNVDDGVKCNSAAMDICLNDSNALAKVTKLQTLMEERLQCRDAACREIKALLDDTHSECSEFKQMSERYWEQWERCKGFKDALISLVAGDTEVEDAGKTALGNDGIPEAKEALKKKLLALLEKHDLTSGSTSLLEHTLVQLLVEVLSIHSVQHYSRSQKILELQRKLHALQMSNPTQNLNSSCCVKEPLDGLQQEVRLQDQVRRLEVQNHRLARMADYLRLKVDHIKRWKSAYTDPAAASGKTGASKVVLAQSHDEDGVGRGQEFTGGPQKEVPAAEPSDKICIELNSGVNQSRESTEKETDWITQVLLQPPGDSQEREAELLSIIRTLGHDSQLTSNHTGNMELCNKRGQEANEEASLNQTLSVSVETKDKLLKLFWLMLGDFYRFEARFTEGSAQIRRLQQCLHENTQRRNELEADIRKCKAELTTTFERRLQKERNNFHRLLGRYRVRLMAAEETVEILRREKARRLEEQEAMMKVFHQTDHSRFATLLERIEAVEAANIMLRSREQCWNELAKALSNQLQQPTDQNQTAIQDIWCQLRGSESLIAPVCEGPKLPEAGESKLQKQKTGSAFVKGQRRRPEDISKRKANITKKSPFKSMSCDPSNADSVVASLKNETSVDEAHTPISMNNVMPHGNRPADPFFQCLKQICGNCDASVDHSNESNLFNGSANLSGVSPEVAKEEPVEEVNSLSIHKHTGELESPKTLLQLPLQWVSVLRQMVEEATAFLEKQCKLKAEELEIIKGDFETQVEKRKQLLARITDQEIDLINLKEEHAFVQNQHEEAMQSLESSYAEVDELKKQQMQLTEKMAKSNAELCLSNRELKRVLATTLANATNVPSITLLCRQYLDERGTDESCHGDTSSNKSSPLKSAHFDIEECRGTHECQGLKRHMIQPRVSTQHLHQGDQTLTIPTAGSYSEEGHKTCDISGEANISCVVESTERGDTLEESFINEKSRGLNVKNYVTTSGAGTSREISECIVERPNEALDTFVSLPADVSEAAPEMTPAALGAGQVTAVTNSCELGRNEAFHSPASHGFPENTPSEESGTSSAATMPTPRSPPKAEQAPLVSPSKLLCAIQRQLNGSTKGPQRFFKSAVEDEPSSKCCNSVQPSHSDGYSSNGAASSSDSCSYFQSSFRQESNSSGTDSRALCESQQTSCSEKQERKLGVDSLSNGTPVREETVKHEATSALVSSEASRAAATRAWEEFVEAYRGDLSKSKNEGARVLPRSRSLFIGEQQQEGTRRTHRLTVGQDLDDGQLMEKRFAHGASTSRNDTCSDDESFGEISFTRETTDSALQEILNIEQGINGDGLHVQSTFLTHKLGVHSHSDVFDDSSQLTTSATNFLRKLGNQLGTRLRPTRQQSPS